MLSQLSRVPPLLLVASAAFFGAAYFTVRFPDTPGAGIASFISTLAIALPSFIALWRYLGPRKAVGSLLALSALGFAVEMTGVVTGFPYGSFYYGDALGPRVFDLVPYLLPISWVPLVLGAVAATGRVAAGRASRVATREKFSGYYVIWVLAAAVLLTLIDGVLDPGAAFLGFWVWPQGGIYYGVPATNYLGWLLSSSLAAALLLYFGRSWGEVAPPPGLLDSAIIAVAFWTGIAVMGGLGFPVVLGAGLYLGLLLRRVQLAAVAERKTGYRGGGDSGKRRLV